MRREEELQSSLAALGGGGGGKGRVTLNGSSSCTINRSPWFCLSVQALFTIQYTNEPPSSSCVRACRENRNQSISQSISAHTRANHQVVVGVARAIACCYASAHSLAIVAFSSSVHMSVSSIESTSMEEAQSIQASVNPPDSNQ